MPEDNKKKIKELGLNALLEQGNVDKFFDVQFKERETDSKAQLIGSIARIGDMLTQHSEGVFVEEISAKLSERMSEMAEQLAQGLSTDLESTEQRLQEFVSETDDSSKSELQADLTAQVAQAQANLMGKIEAEIRSALPELAESAKLTDDEVEDIISNASLSVESQMSEIIGQYLLQSPLSINEIDGFQEAVQNIVSNVDLSDVKVKFDNIQDLPPVLDRYIRGGGKTQLRFLADVDVSDLSNGNVLTWNSSTENFEASVADSLPSQTGNSGKYLTTDGTDASWATLSGGGDMAAATYDPAGKEEQVLTISDPVVEGPASATNNAIARYDGTTGKLLQDSGVYIGDTGNLGIGITSPSQELSVFGDIELTKEDGSFPSTTSYAYSDTSFHGPRYAMFRAGGTEANPTAVTTNQYIGWLDFFGHDGTSYNRTGQFLFTSDAGVATGINPGRVNIQTTDTSGSLQSRFLARADGATFMAIGPDHKLKLGGSGNAPNNKLDVEGACAIGSSYAAVQTAPTDGLLVEGNVGIGETAPLNKLDVAGGVVIGNNDAGVVTAPANGLSVEGSILAGGVANIDGELILGNTADGSDISLAGKSGVSNTLTYTSDNGGLLTWSINAGADRYVQYTNIGAGTLGLLADNMGIGTASPSAMLDVEDSGTGDLLELRRTGIGYYTIDFAGGTANIETDVNHILQSSNGVSLVTNNVTDATAKLVRFGSPHYTNAEQPFITIFSNSNSVSNALNLGGGTSSGNAATEINFHTAADTTTTTGTERMTISSAGNVGIGSTTPDTTLDVNGAITQRPLSADPSDPDAGNSVTWVSDGTGSGDAGDVMMKINVGGTTKTLTLVDYSALS